MTVVAEMEVVAMAATVGRVMVRLRREEPVGAATERGLERTAAQLLRVVLESPVCSAIDDGKE